MRGAYIAVGTAALLSLLATTFFFAFAAYVWLRRTTQYAKRKPFEQASIFLRSQFGVLFLNLCLGDTFQALGFLIDFHWVSLGDIDASSAVCTAQGVLIELGDMASTFFCTLIAFHTFFIIAVGIKFRRSILYASIIVTWLAAALLTMLGPAAVETKTKGPFYGLAGNWCFIANEYDEWRLYLHYLWVFVAILVNIGLYAALFIVLQRRRRRQQTVVADSLRFDIRRYVPFDLNSRNSFKMLSYPLAYLVLVLPLAIFRVVQFAGHNSSREVQAAVGCVFTLSGFVNVLLYTFTRNLFTLKHTNKAGQISGYAFPISHLDIETYASKEKEQDGMAPQVIELKDSSHHGKTQSVQNPEFVVNVEKRQSITYSRA